MCLWFLAIFLLFVYACADVHYYLRVIIIYVFAKYCKTKIKFTDPSEVYGIVIPSDADFMFTHMNNARYLREYDFARFDHATRSGLIIEMFSKGGGFPVAAHTIRYRLPLKMFSLYKVVTQPIWWDTKFIYVDQRMVTLSDGIVRSVGYCKITVNFNVEEFIEKYYPDVVKPEIPEDMKRWIEYNALSSDMMKKSR